MDDYYLKEDTYKIIGICVEVHKILGKDHSEIKQTLNYLAVSKNKISLLVNFSEDNLKYKRIIL